MSARLTRRDLPVSSAPVVLRGSAARRPNFFFVFADDHAGPVLGAAGDRLALTSNLGRLSSEGTRLANHYCNSAVCTPSRRSLLTGQLPHMAGVTRPPTPLDPSKPSPEAALEFYLHPRDARVPYQLPGGRER